MPLVGLDSLKIYLTNKCQLSCEYCNHKKDNDHMTLEIAKKIIKKINKNNIKEIIFFGGEPLLNFPVLKYFVEQLCPNVALGFTTNAIALKGEIAEFLAKNPEVKVQISLDPDMSARTKQYSDIIIENTRKFIRKIHAQGGVVEVNSVIKYDYFDLYKEKFYDYLLYDLEFDLVNSCFYGKKKEPQGLKVWPELCKEIEDWLLKGYRPPYCGIDGYIRINYEDAEKIGGCFYCRSCTKEITIAPDGSLYACYQFYKLRKFIIGHIDSGIDYQKRREWFLLKKQRYSSCLKCDYFQVCRGGCGYSHYLETGNFHTNGLNTCHSRKSYFDIGKQIYLNVVKRGSKNNLNFLKSRRLWRGYYKRYFDNLGDLDLKDIKLSNELQKELKSNLPSRDSFNIYLIRPGYYTLYIYGRNKLYKIDEKLASLLEIGGNNGIEYAIAFLNKKFKIPLNQSIEFAREGLAKIKSLF